MKKLALMGVVILTVIAVVVIFIRSSDRPVASNQNLPDSSLSNVQSPSDNASDHSTPQTLNDSEAQTVSSSELNPTPEVKSEDAPTSDGWLVLTGRVTTKESGAPAPGARVWLSSVRQTNISIQKTALAETIADADGRYEFRLPDLSWLLVEAEHTGYARAGRFVIPEGINFRDEWRPEGVRLAQCDIVLEPAAPLMGRVEDETGHPIGGATLAAVVIRDGGMGLKEAAYYKLEAESAADGSFSFAHTPAVRIQLTAIAPGYVEHQEKVNAPKSNHIIRLSREGGTIRGVVYDLETKQPAAGAPLNLLRGSEFQNLLDPITAEANELGEFEFPLLKPGQYRMASGQPGRHLLYQPESKINLLTVKTGEDSPPLELWLYAGHILNGVVLESISKQPIPGVRVTQGFGEVTHSATSGEDGRFIITGLGSTFGGAALIATKPGYHQVLDTYEHYLSVPLPHDHLEVPVTILMAKGVTVSGVVQTEDGAPVRNARAGILKNDGIPPVYAPNSELGEDGVFALDAPAFSTIRISVKAPGYPAAESAPVELKDKDVSGIVVTLRDGVTVRGIVEDSEGKAVEGARVRAQRYYSIGGVSHDVILPQVISDVEGSFAYEMVPQSYIYFFANKDGYAPSESYMLNLRENQNPDLLRIQLREAMTVMGRVTDADGEPVEGAHILFQSEGYPSSVSKSADSDRDGKFMLDGMTHGLFDIHFWHNDHGAENLEKIKVGDDPVELKFKSTKTATLTGRVVDYATKQPVEKFTVTDQHNQLVIAVDPDRPGVFTASKLNTKYVYMFTIKAEGYLDLNSDYFGAPEGVMEFERTFVMGPGGTISGRCVAKNADGQLTPLAGVQVAVRHHNQYQRTTLQPFDIQVTDEEGRFKSNTLEDAQYHVEFVPPEPFVIASRSAKVRHSETFELGDIVMTGGGTIKGRLVKIPGETPLAGETIMLIRRDQGRSLGKVTTDDDGRFMFDNLVAVPHMLFCAKYETSTEVSVRAGETHEATLRVGSGILRGKVIRRGAPVLAHVIIMRDSVNSGANVETDAEGKFEFAQLVPGVWSVSIQDSRSPASINDFVEITADEPAERTFEFPSGRIWGRVLDADDKPVENADVMARLQTPEGGASDSIPLIRRTKSGPDGSFEFGELSAGLYAISASLTDRGAAHAPGIEVPEDGDSGEVILKLRRGGGTLVSIAVAQMDSTKHPIRAGDPIPLAWCRLTTETGAPYDHGLSRGDDGRLTIAELPPGQYTMEVGWTDYSINRRIIEIKEGETLEVRDELYNAGELRLALEEADGRAIAKAECRIAPLDDANPEAPRQGRTDPAGVWVVPGLWPGGYSVVMDMPDGRAHQIEVYVTSQQITEHRETIR